MPPTYTQPNGRIGSKDEFPRWIHFSRETCSSVSNRPCGGMIQKAETSSSNEKIQARFMRSVLTLARLLEMNIMVSNICDQSIPFKVTPWKQVMFLGFTNCNISEKRSNRRQLNCTLTFFYLLVPNLQFSIL